MYLWPLSICTEFYNIKRYWWISLANKLIAIEELPYSIHFRKGNTFMGIIMSSQGLMVEQAAMKNENGAVLQRRRLVVA